VIAPAFVPVGGGGTPAASVAAPVAAPVAAIVTTPATGNASVALGDLPDLGSIGKVGSTVADGSSVARTLLSTGTGRPIAVVLALLGAILLFLSIHRRVDRSDPKLTAVNAGPDVARFR
jgi:hypothetical protein